MGLGNCAARACPEALIGVSAAGSAACLLRVWRGLFVRVALCSPGPRMGRVAAWALVGGFLWLPAYVVWFMGSRSAFSYPAGRLRRCCAGLMGDGAYMARESPCRSCRPSGAACCRSLFRDVQRTACAGSAERLVR